MTAQEELRALLRPAGGGLYLVSSGKKEQLELQERLYGVSGEKAVKERHLALLEKLASARVLMLGVPSDVGAGLVRGANLGPQAIRLRLLEDDPDWSQWCQARGAIDLGDVFVIPQLLHDEMLSQEQKSASRRAIYPDLGTEVAVTLPVSPLSITERVLELALRLNPNAKPLVLGGDHSVAWPVTRALSSVQKRPWGVVQIDAHTDLLEERLGVKYCFGTWSYHANELLGRNGRLVQVGIRASGKERAHWEGRYGVRQFWADQVRADPSLALEEIVSHVKASGVSGVYFSNDIDGTDEAYADATGTPEPDGLEPAFVRELIFRLGREVGLLAGDVMEVAPPLNRSPEGPRRTVGLAADYVRCTIQALVGESPKP